MCFYGQLLGLIQIHFYLFQPWFKRRLLGAQPPPDRLGDLGGRLGDALGAVTNSCYKIPSNQTPEQQPAASRAQTPEQRAAARPDPRAEQQQRAQTAAASRAQTPEQRAVA
jgi:hypothetical protein